MIPNWFDAEKRVRRSKKFSALDKFVCEHESIDGVRKWRKDLKGVLEETRIKENLRLRTIFQDYMSFLPKEHIEELINKLK